MFIYELIILDFSGEGLYLLEPDVSFDVESQKRPEHVRGGSAHQHMRVTYVYQQDLRQCSCLLTTQFEKPFASTCGGFMEP